MFARRGILEVFRSDNEPKFVSKSFHEFTSKYQIRQTKSSPHNPESDGEAERMVKVAKDIPKKAEDPDLALLIYRTTQDPAGSIRLNYSWDGKYVQRRLSCHPS